MHTIKTKQIQQKSIYTQTYTHIDTYICIVCGGVKQSKLGRKFMELRVGVAMGGTRMEEC